MKGHEQDMENTPNTSTSTAYTWKSLSADLTVLSEITPGWKDEDGPFHVIIEDRGRDYPYRYTLVMAWNDYRGKVSYTIPGFPSGEYFRTPRELRGAMHSAAYDASWVMEVRS